MDRTTGQMSDTRTRFLGTKPPKLFGANVKGQRAMLALSKRPWLGYSDMGRYNLTPLSYETLDFASGGLECMHRRPQHAPASFGLQTITFPAGRANFWNCFAIKCWV